MVKFNKTKTIAFLIFSLILVFFLSKKSFHNFVHAGIGENVSGFAWSENIGWISFNSTDCDQAGGFYTGTPAGCPSTQVFDYGVAIDEVSGDFSGYAWSENIGWIGFTEADIEDLVAYPGCGFPEAPCNAANYDSTTGAVTGWAKILTLGDDGWIKMSDDTVANWNGLGANIDPYTSDLFGWAWNAEETYNKVNPAGTYIEAENFTGTISQGTGTFSVETSRSGYLGDGYIKSYNGEIGACPPKHEGKEYLVNFTETGTYNVWLRGYATDGGSNGVFIGLDGGCVGDLEETLYNQWSWTNAVNNGSNTIIVNTTGLHTLNVWVRESNHLLDGIYITKGGETPTDGSHGTKINPTTPYGIGIGWISFNCTNDTPPCENSDYKVHYGISPPDAPTIGAIEELACSYPDPVPVKINWTDNSDNETGFEVEVSEDLLGPWSHHCELTYVMPDARSAETAEARSCSGNLSEDTAYYFRVKAVNGGGPSGWSTSGAHTTGFCIPDLTAEIETATCDFLVLDWGYGGNASVNEYAVYRNEDGGLFSEIATTSPAATPDANTYKDTDIASGITYRYYIVARPQDATSNILLGVKPCPSLPTWREIKP